MCESTRRSFAKSLIARTGPVWAGCLVLAACGGGDDDDTSTKLTDEDVVFSAEWSPDGTRLAYEASLGGLSDIYVIAADGSDRVNLTESPDSRDGYPTWSPDGSRIAFQSDRAGGAMDVYVMDADGSDVVRLTDHPDNDGFAVFSPDGTQLAFATDRDGQEEIYVMEADGTALKNLTGSPRSDTMPTWSPDGTQLAFWASAGDIDSAEIYVMDADGSNEVRLTNNTSLDGYPGWSPEGDRLVFTSRRDDRADIYVMDADGEGTVRVTDDEAGELYPRWSPDGSTIAYVSDGDGTPALHLTPAPGAGAEPADPPPSGAGADPLVDLNGDDPLVDLSGNAVVRLTGSALVSGSGLRLTESRSTGQSSGAWLSGKQPLADGFVSEFDFVITSAEVNPGDGFAFVVQNTAQTPTAAEGAASGIGYKGMPNSLAIEFDTVSHDYESDAQGDHVAVHTRGTEPNTTHVSASRGSVASPASLADGLAHTATVDYEPGTLSVSLDGSVILEVDLDLSTTLRLDEGSAFVGFTASTEPGFTSNHDILEWSFRTSGEG